MLIRRTPMQAPTIATGMTGGLGKFAPRRAGVASQSEPGRLWLRQVDEIAMDLRGMCKLVLPMPVLLNASLASGLRGPSAVRAVATGLPSDIEILQESPITGDAWTRGCRSDHAPHTNAISRHRKMHFQMAHRSQEACSSLPRILFHSVQVPLLSKFSRAQ